MENQKVTYIKIENGKVYASGEVKPIEDTFSSIQYPYIKAMEKFNQSFVEVSVGKCVINILNFQ